EVDDGSEIRIEKIARLIASCRLGIHDISRTELDATTALPRFNMPLELGLFLGAKRFGRAQQKIKSCLILDRERHRYQKFISDIAGQDIASHGGNPNEAIKAVRNWLSNLRPKTEKMPGGAVVAERYASFRDALPKSCAEIHLRESDLTFNNYVTLVEEWLDANALVPRV
ncbi:MAG TPA: hypothetical protein VN181_17095, partial [Thermoanaerobaculia bacterium]|nr:hypothetical protein [Thermoanaerobaculia bacterium]